MKCFFALSAKGWPDQFNHMALALAKSAKLCTSLDMFCIYDGTPSPTTDHLTRLGVRILAHQPRHTHLLEASASRKIKRRGSHGIWQNPDLWNGTFLRLEIPLLMQQLGFRDPFVLYVDADTFFQSDPQFAAIQPDFLAAASESDPRNTSFFNAGIMLFNTHTMLETYPRFLQFCKDQDFVPAWGLLDQGLYNTFYRGKWLHLAPEFNWKAYWPLNPAASIIHFHGPNPADIAAHQKAPTTLHSAKPIADLLQKHPENLRAHLKLWQTSPGSSVSSSLADQPA